MTTIATKDGIVACDSQVTGTFLESGKKVYQNKKMIVGFCGDWVAADHVMRIYLAGKELDPDKDVDRDDDFELMVLKKSGIYLVDKWLREVKICGTQYAIGSGSQAAMVAMNMGATAKEAIKEAMKVDPYTGGRIRTYQHG